MKETALVECLAGVKLPHEFHGGQRAPVEFHLTNVVEGRWACRIKIRRADPERGCEQDQHANDITFGDPLTDPSKVELVLREAHRYLLNDDPLVQWPNNFEKAPNLNEEPSQRGPFCSNSTISVEIQGHSVMNSILVTLPNFASIRSSRSLKSLALQYFSSNCMILLLTKGSDHLQVHPAFLLARQADPLGNRTFGLFPAEISPRASLGQTKNIETTTRSGWRIPFGHRLFSDFFSEPTSKASLLPSRKGSMKLFRTPNITSNWRVQRWQGQNFPQPTFDMTCDLSGVKRVLENMYLELLEASAPGVLNMMLQTYSETLSIFPPINETHDGTSDDVFVNIYTACATKINGLLIATSNRQALWNKIEEVYVQLKRRAFVDLPLLIPLSHRDDDVGGLDQISTLADRNLYPDGYQLKSCHETYISAHRPKVYLSEVRSTLKRIQPQLVKGAIPFGIRTPLMTLPVEKWTSYASDAMLSVICLLKNAIDLIIVEQCARTPYFQSCIEKLVYSQVNQVFFDAQNTICKQLESELVLSTQSLPQLMNTRSRLLQDYHLTRDLVYEGGKSNRTPVTRHFGMPQQNHRRMWLSAENRASLHGRPKPATSEWELEINASAEGAAYCHLALDNFLAKTSVIIHQTLLERVHIHDLNHVFNLSEPKLQVLAVSCGYNHGTESSRSSTCFSGERPMPVEVTQLIEELEAVIQCNAEEINHDDPFRK